MAEKEFRMELKRIFRDYKRMNQKMESSLRRLGIEIVRKKNHVVLSIEGISGVRMIPISSTGSDWRSGLNMVPKIVYAKYH